MDKPAALRTFLAAAIPELARDPDRLNIYIDDGSVATTFAPGLSWEYRYTLNIIATDFTAGPDILMAPLIDWLRVHQPDLLQNPEQAERAIRFEADILSNDAVDLSITLNLTERVQCVARAEGGYTATHLPEPQPEAPLEPTHWQLYVADQVEHTQTLIAEWNSPSVG